MPEADTGLDLAADAALLAGAVREAGAVALGYFRRQPRAWSKDNDSPVSEADLAADAVLANALGDARPDYGWLSEESGSRAARRAGEPTWVVDPIDGTRAFLNGRTGWTVSVGLVVSGRPVLAAVFNPAEERFFSARAGGGAQLNGAPIRTGTRATLDGARLLAQDTVLKARRWRLPWPGMELRKVNSIAYRICLVACGEADATLSASAKSAWDLAAADLIVREAGGLITAFNGVPFVYNRPRARIANVVCAGKALHEALIAHIAASDTR